jgi:hypothetical protein
VEIRLRDYGRVYSAFWQSPEIRALPEDARTLALYLLTAPHGNLIGCFRLPDAYAADDLQWTAERVSEGFRKLEEAAFVRRDEATKWVFIAKYLKWNAFENPNVARAAHKALDQVPALSLKPALALALLEFGQHLTEELTKACQTLSEPLRKPEPTGTVSGAVSGARTRAKPKPTSPAAADAATVAPTKAVWASYSEAYGERYGVPPVRNAKVNSQILQLVHRLGAEEAPAVAAYFVGHQNQLYVRAMHPTDFLLRDAEKLRTEWATRRQVTNAQAVQADRTQTNLSAFAPLIAEAKARESKERNDAERSAA